MKRLNFESSATFRLLPRSKFSYGRSLLFWKAKCRRRWECTVSSASVSQANWATQESRWSQARQDKCEWNCPGQVRWRPGPGIEDWDAWMEETAEWPSAFTFINVAWTLLGGCLNRGHKLLSYIDLSLTVNQEWLRLCSTEWSLTEDNTPK